MTLVASAVQTAKYMYDKQIPRRGNNHGRDGQRSNGRHDGG